MTLATTEQSPASQLVRYNDANNHKVALNVEFVRRYFCQKATPDEAFGFMRFCEYHQLNPFLRDAYLIKYDSGEAAQMVIGYHVWIQRADTDPRYEGFKAGVILQTEAGLERRQGAFYIDGETLLGGWCEVMVQGREPTRVEVALKEYDRQRALWKTHKATMIQKVATAQAFRFAFPRLFGGAYDQSEIGPDTELPDDVITVEMPPQSPTVETPTLSSGVTNDNVQRTGFDTLLDWVWKQGKDLPDLQAIITAPVNRESVAAYMEAQDLTVSTFVERLKSVWAEGAEPEPDANEEEQADLL